MNGLRRCDIYVCVPIYIYMHVCVCVCVCIIEYYSVHKKNEILLFSAMRINIENIMLSGLSQTDKYCIPLVCEI